MVKSLDRSLAILIYISKRKDVSVTEIAKEFDINKGTVSRILKSFEKHGMVAKNTNNPRYHIGSGTLKLSYNVVLNNHIIQIAKHTLEELARMTDTTARLCMIDGKSVFIIDQVCGAKSNTMQKYASDADIPGTDKPLYCSAIGKTMLAFMPARRAREIIDKLEKVAYTENTIVDRDALFVQLAEIREKGYALNLAEFSDRAYCIAVPVPTDEFPTYSIGISGWTDFRKDGENFKKIIMYMKKASKTIASDYNRFRNSVVDVYNMNNS